MKTETHDHKILSNSTSNKKKNI